MNIRILLIGAAALVFPILAATPAIAAESSDQERTPFCVLRVNYPHASAHVSGTINVTATTSCPTAMTSIYIDTELQRTAPSAGRWWNGFGVTRVGAASATDNQATSCSAGPGTFRGWAETRIVPPPGYQLSSSPYEYKYGTAIAVACGVGKSLAPVPTDTVEVQIEYERIGEG